MKKLLFILCLLKSFDCFSQFMETTSLVSIKISGNTQVEEGSTEEYLIQYTINSALPGGQTPIFTPHIIKGAVVSFKKSLLAKLAYDLVILWDCKPVGDGNIKINETITSSSASLNVKLSSYANTPNKVTQSWFCNIINKENQNLVFGQTPNPLAVTCTKYCTNAYQFQYQWQKRTGGTTANPIFTDIVAAISDKYYPPTYNTLNTSEYRRRTSFNIGVVPYTYYSQVAVVKFFDPLFAGSINTPSQFVYVNTALNIFQTAASGGACPNTGILYTWEKQNTLDLIWYSIGNAQEAPGGIVVTQDINIRRKAECGGQVLYTNVIELKVRPQLLPGIIAAQVTTNLAYGTIPVVTQTPATGGLCNTQSYMYTWERQLTEGVWNIIGTTENYPANMPMVSTMKLRRKVSCNNEVLFTNVLTITMASYTSPNIENLNYVRINDILIPGVHTWAQADGLPTGSKLQTTTYLDAFGRPIQQVVKQGSLKANASTNVNDVNNYQDLVSITDYDGLGRTAKGFLPYATTTKIGFFKTNAYTEQETYNNILYNEPAGSHFTFSTTQYDGSPLNRVTAVKSAGAAYQVAANNGITSDFDFNTQTENIHKWDIGFTTGSKPIDVGVYTDNTLVKNITKDQKGKLIFEYKDLSGNVILKKVQEKDAPNINMLGYAGWLSTYYVYDDFGRLRYTITPKAVADMIAASINNIWVVTDPIKNGLCFYQEYDKRGRVIKKHAADGGEVWMVYDKRDRLVLTQDENQRHRSLLNPPKPNQWSFALYDEHDRSIATGLINDTRGLASMQALADAVSANVQNVDVALYTGSWVTIKAYLPVAGRAGVAGGLYCAPCTGTFTNSITYYDRYNADAKPFVSVVAFATSTNTAEPFVKTDRVNGMAVGGKIRVLDDKYDNLNETDDKFLASTTYYDERTRVIQSHAENIQGGTDYSSMQYDYPGKVLTTNIVHRMPGNEFDNFVSNSKNEYDLLHRPIRLSKAYFKGNADDLSTNENKKLSEYRYDELGRLKTKKIGANPTNPINPMETLDYSYNMQGMLTGVNKDYALAGAEGGELQFVDQFSRRFGYYLGYENADNKFAAAQYNGNITGVIWRSQGDNKPRKYNYEYDNVDRFVKANFSQKETPLEATTAYTTVKVDLSASVGGYDANGNILSMLQKGIVPGIQGAIILDNMQYAYYTNSSKLKAVTDLANTNYSGKQGDFKDYAAVNAVDYNYDLNGNLKYDKNKGIIAANADVTNLEPSAGIISNFLDLPESITIKGKSRTEYLYDAAGNKLAKKVISLATPPVTTPPTPVTPTKTTYFIGGYVYEALTPVATGVQTTPVLQYIIHEEGKLRIIEPVAAWSPPSGAVNRLDITGNIELINSGNIHKWGVWDYHLKDNLSNTRMVLTEEKHIQEVFCSMESIDPVRKNEEDATFGANELTLTRENRPQAWPSGDPNNVKAAKLLYNPALTAQNGGVGPNVIFKVMAGDKILPTANYFYQQNAATSDNGNGILPNIIAGIINAIGGPGVVSSGIKDNVTNSYLSTNAIITPFTNTQPAPASPATPRAYLNVIFFDEQFNYVPEQSKVKPIDPVPNVNGTVSIPNIKVPKNGYVYVYLSNDSRNIPVYFDNFTVKHTRDVIVEDNAYYPYGLKIQGISAKAALKPHAKEGYQGDYTEHDEESWYDEFLLRSYDAQIGRFIQVDPKLIQPGMYNGMSNDPVNNIDPDGGGPTDWFRNIAGELKYFAGKGVIDVMEGYTYAFKEGVEGGIFFDADGFTSVVKTLETVLVGSVVKKNYGESVLEGAKERASGMVSWESLFSFCYPVQALQYALHKDPAGTVKGLGQTAFNLNPIGLTYNMTFNPKQLGVTVVDLATIAVTHKVSTGIGGKVPKVNVVVVEEVVNGGAAELATGWQGKGAYTGVDNWRNITLADGKNVVGGLPGQSNYYTTIKGLNKSGINQVSLFEGLQVAKHPQFGYRGQVGVYEVTGNTPAAFGTTYANPQFGAGGLPQIYIPDYSGLRLIKTISLK
jgi:RHS repeat-associated protein